MLLTEKQMKAKQLQQLKELRKNGMDINESLEYIEASTVDKSIKFGLIHNVVKGEHEISKINPLMDNQEFEQLKYSILQTGQQEPILLYRGLIVDGRHRTEALKELGCEYILYSEIPRNTRLSEIKEIVMSKNARRNLTKSQKAIQAYFDYIENGGTKQSYAIKYGTDRTYISKAETIAKELGINKLDTLLNSGKVKLNNGKYYTNLSSIMDYISRKKKKEKEIIDYKPKDDDVKECINLVRSKNLDLAQLAEMNKTIKALMEKKFKDD